MTMATLRQAELPYNATHDPLFYRSVEVAPGMFELEQLEVGDCIANAVRHLQVGAVSDSPKIRALRACKTSDEVIVTYYSPRPVPTLQ